MDYETALQKAKSMVAAAKEIVVVTRANPTMDSMGGSLALMLGVVSLGKKATVICPDPMTVGLSSFVGADKVSRGFGKKNFVISLDYVDGSIEKVSYNIEGKKFNLVIEHRPGFEPISAEKVQYDYQGASADLIISVDTLNFGQLGDVYEKNKDLFAGKQIINVDFHDANSNYGAINLVDPGASSSSELVAELLATLGVKLTTDIATNLLNAIYDATNNFQNTNVTSMAFEVASVCLKAGAKRFGAPDRKAPQQTAKTQAVPVEEQPKVFVNNQPVSPQDKQQKDESQNPVLSSGAPTQEPAALSKEHKPEPKVTETGAPATPPSDWLKPKIFKSSSLL